MVCGFRNGIRRGHSWGTENARHVEAAPITDAGGQADAELSWEPGRWLSHSSARVGAARSQKMRRPFGRPSPPSPLATWPTLPDSLLHRPRVAHPLQAGAPDGELGVLLERTHHSVPPVAQLESSCLLAT